ncbi:MAG: bifunctional 4-hydroxy-2-oxoglutarate aldolase/2-dehydro-3-deoxy-phosphogluconate aldolase [Candidatus Limnocylindrales bacterium]
MSQSRQQVIQALDRTGVVAVVRIDRPADLPRLAAALGEGGVVLIEITMTVPGALAAISETVRELGEAVFVGAGTVLDATTARLAINAGAAFVVGPSLDLPVIEMAHRYGVAVVPGCLTPTEIVQAWTAGADAVKLFPGRVATPGYFADLRGPLPQVRMMPTGNVDLTTTAEYIRAGAVAVGVGKALVATGALDSGDWRTITSNARRFREVVDQARAER